VIDEGDDDLRKVLGDSWISREGALQILELLAGTSSAGQQRTHELLELIAASGSRCDWLALRPFIGRDAETDAYIARLMRVSSPSEALSWLLEIAVRALDPMPAVVDRDTGRHASAVYAAAYAAWGKLAEILPSVDPGTLSGTDRSRLGRLTDSLAGQLEEERALARWEEGLDLDTLPEREQPESYRQNVDLLFVLRRIVAE
jgi:hypothetical protein